MAEDRYLDASEVSEMMRGNVQAPFARQPEPEGPPNDDGLWQAYERDCQRWAA